MVIFKAYDIRGIYPTELNEDIFYRIAKSFAVFIRGKRIVVGGDNRLSTPSLKKSFIQGLLDSGVDVVDIGTVATSMVYFSCYKLGFDGGAMITASHNPKEFNGIKLCGSDGLSIGLENGLDKIKIIMEKSQFKNGKGGLTKQNILSDYKKFIKNLSRDLTGMKIVIDGSNGSAGLIYSDILHSLGADVVELFCEPDGNFPHHKIPDPLIDENLNEIKSEVKKTKANIGLAFDGDGDRIIIINGNGEKVNTNHISALLSEEILKENKNAKIVFDVLSSQLVDEVVKQNGGTPVRWKVGHSIIPRKCKELHAPFAGEASSHYFFKESNYTDDTIVAAVKILDIIMSEKRKLSELTNKYPIYYQEIEKRIPIPEEMKFKFIEDLKHDFKKQGYNLSTIDGVKVKFKNGWAVFRASNTESKIVISYESPSKNDFKDIQDFVNKTIRKIPPDNSEIKLIIFDLEKVLTPTWREVFDLPELQHIPRSTIIIFFDDHNDLRKELQYGRLTEDEFWTKFIEFTKLDLDVEFLKQSVRKVMIIKPEMINILNSLKKNYKIVLLSNFSRELADYVIKKYSLDKKFDAMFWSFEKGIKKPLPEAYNQVIRKFNVRPGECLFIDDRERNIEGARMLGIKTILYKNPQELKHEFSSMKIKIDDIDIKGKPNVVIIGGGTGSSTVIKGLKKYVDCNISTIVPMGDSGGSTGRLREQFGILSAGEIRQRLIALAEDDGNNHLVKILDHRFERGNELRGHNMGNILIAALTEFYGSQEKAIDALSSAINAKGKIIPSTWDSFELIAEYSNGKKIVGEHSIDESNENARITRLYTKPSVKANPAAIEAIKNADFIIFGPGDLYTSVLHNVVVDGMADAIQSSNAKKIYISNLMTSHGETTGMSLQDLIKEVEKYIKSKLDTVLVNSKKLPPQIVSRYQKNLQFPVKIELNEETKRRMEIIQRDLLSEETYTKNNSDILERSMLRHGPDKLGILLNELINGE